MNTLRMILGGLGLGAFKGLFAAGPALGMIAIAPEGLRVGMSKYLKCQNIAL